MLAWARHVLSVRAEEGRPWRRPTVSDEHNSWLRSEVTISRIRQNKREALLNSRVVGRCLKRQGQATSINLPTKRGGRAINLPSFSFFQRAWPRERQEKFIYTFPSPAGFTEAPTFQKAEPAAQSVVDGPSSSSLLFLCSPAPVFEMRVLVLDNTYVASCERCGISSSLHALLQHPALEPRLWAWSSLACMSSCSSFRTAVSWVPLG